MLVSVESVVPDEVSVGSEEVSVSDDPVVLVEPELLPEPDEDVDVIEAT